MRYLILVVMAALLAPAGREEESSMRGFTIDDGFRLRLMSSRMAPDASPDGQLVAACFASREHEIDIGAGPYLSTGITIEVDGSEIWLLNETEARRITSLDESAWAPRWSPDGQTLAYFSDLGGKPRLWLWDRSTEEASPIEGAIVRTFFGYEWPEWSPDGRHVHFKALAPEYEKHYGQSNSLWPRGAAPFVPATSRRAQREGQREGQGEAFVEVKGGELAGSAMRRRVVGETPGDELGMGIIDLVRYDVVSKTIQRLLKGRTLRDFDVSPDGTKLCAMVVLGLEKLGAQQPMFRLELIDLETGEARTLLDEIRETYGISTSWSPDSSKIALITSGPLASGDLLVVDIESRDVQNLTKLHAMRLVNGENERRPLWHPDGESLVVVAHGNLWRFGVDGSLAKESDGGVVGVVAANESSTAFLWDSTPLAQIRNADGAGFGTTRFGVGPAKAHYVDGASMQSNTRFSADAEAGAVFRVARYADGPDRIERIDLESASMTPLASPNHWLDDIDQGRIEMLEWDLGARGQAKGTLLLPSCATLEDPPACIVIVYAGSRPSRNAGRFGLGLDPGVSHPLLFTARGWAVFFPDLPLGADEEPMRAIWEMTEPALDALGESGLVDMDRLGVFGHSYGGYTVNALLVQTDRFRAAIASTGSSHMTSMFLHEAAQGRGTGWFETGQGRMRATPWEDPERYVRNSPVYHLDKVTSPLLLIHSEDDWAYEQSVEVFGGLKRLGKTVELATYFDADHWYGAWSNEKLRDFWDRVLTWYGEHLDPAQISD